jgi:hypothetical protein
MATSRAGEAGLDRSIGDDILWGLEEIATELGLDHYQVRYRAQAGQLPVRRIGRRYFASRAELRDYLFGRASAARRL